jgi:hypothetical protein
MKWRREGDLNPRGPERPQADWCLLFRQASPGLLPAWLGDPGNEIKFGLAMVCILSLT